MPRKNSFEPLELRPVSPIRLYDTWEEYSPISPQPLPHQNAPPGMSYTDIPLANVANEDIADGRSQRWGTKDSVHESEEPMLETANVDSSSSQHERDDTVHATLLEPKTQRFLPHWILAFSTVAVSIFSTVYSYRVLVSQDAIPNPLSITPGQTVLVVNILSHLVAFMCWTLFSNATEALRWALACREQGVRLTTFLALSRATPLGGVAYLCVVRGYHQIWSVQRFLSIIIVTVLGLVLITDVTFKNIYTSSSANQPLNILAGLAPLNTSLLQFAPPELASLFITAYNLGFVTDPKFVTTVPPLSCSSGPKCKSLFLPGGLELVRMQGQDKNATLFGSNLPADYTTVVIQNAPGFHLEFYSLGTGFVFDPAACKLYGESISDGLYICLTKDGPTMVAGWSVCPSSLATAHNCSTNTTWMESAHWSLQLTLSQRFATVAYDGRNNSILSIESIGSPHVVPIDPLDFEAYHNLALSPVPKLLNTSDPRSRAAANSYTAQYGLTWLLRVYQEQFEQYQNGGLELLEGLLAVSIQFNTQMWSNLGFASLPDNMKTVATLQKVSYRAVIRPWTVWTFGALAFLILSWSIGCLIWVCLYGPYSPNTSMFPEIDITSKSSCHNLPRTLFLERRIEASEETLEDLGKLTRMKGLGNGMSRAVVEAIKTKRIRCGSYKDANHSEQMIVIVTGNDIVNVNSLELNKYV